MVIACAPRWLGSGKRGALAVSDADAAPRSLWLASAASRLLLSSSPTLSSVRRRARRAGRVAEVARAARVA